MEGGGWRVEGGGWRVEGGGWRAEGGDGAQFQRGGVGGQHVHVNAAGLEEEGIGG